MNVQGFLFTVLVSLGFAASSVLLKVGMNKLGRVNLTLQDAVPLVLRAATSPYIVLGLLVSLLATLFYLDLLSKYALNYVFPLLSLMYIFVAIAGIVFLGEQLSLLNWIGILFICIGVGFISIKVL